MGEYLPTGAGLYKNLISTGNHGNGTGCQGDLFDGLDLLILMLILVLSDPDLMVQGRQGDPSRRSVRVGLLSWYLLTGNQKCHTGGRWALQLPSGKRERGRRNQRQDHRQR